jgi:hypothetical protein
LAGDNTIRPAGTAIRHVFVLHTKRALYVSKLTASSSLVSWEEI